MEASMDGHTDLNVQTMDLKSTNPWKKAVLTTLESTVCRKILDDRHHRLHRY